MALTRRHFVEALGAASASVLGGTAGAAAQSAAPATPARSPIDSAAPLRLDQNENPYGPGPSVTRAVMEAVNRGN